jgi:hypothetical protein
MEAGDGRANGLPHLTETLHPGTRSPMYDTALHPLDQSLQTVFRETIGRDSMYDSSTMTKHLPVVHKSSAKRRWLPNRDWIAYQNFRNQAGCYGPLTDFTSSQPDH